MKAPTSWNILKMQTNVSTHICFTPSLPRLKDGIPVSSLVLQSKNNLSREKRSDYF